MLNEIELCVYDKFIKKLIFEEDGELKILEKNLEKLGLSSREKEFVMFIINKKKIKIVAEKITKKDRSPYVRDNNYGNIQANELQEMDEPVMSRIEYSYSGDRVFEDYEKLDEYLGKNFIPNYVLLKKKKVNGEWKYFSSIRLHNILALRLSEAELEHVMDYLDKNNIRIGGKGATLEGNFVNYDYVNTYKEFELPTSLPAQVTLEKIHLYKQNKDKKLRDEIIIGNMRLVPYVAYRYAIATGIDQHELESYGYEGLILALEKFDINYGCFFSAFAVAYIKGYVLRGIEENLTGKRSVFYNDYMTAKAVVEENGATLKENPSLIDDVIDLLIASRKIGNRDSSRKTAKRRIISWTLGDVYLDDEEVQRELEQTGQLIDEYDGIEEMLNDTSKELIDKVMKSLRPQEVKVLRLRFGFDDGEPKLLEEVGELFGVTKERVRQIEAKAIRKLRNPVRSQFLADYYDVSGDKFFSGSGISKVKRKI